MLTTQTALEREEGGLEIIVVDRNAGRRRGRTRGRSSGQEHDVGGFTRHRHEIDAQASGDGGARRHRFASEGVADAVVARDEAGAGDVVGAGVVTVPGTVVVEPGTPGGRCTRSSTLREATSPRAATRSAWGSLADSSRESAASDTGSSRSPSNAAGAAWSSRVPKIDHVPSPLSGLAQRRPAIY